MKRYTCRLVPLVACTALTLAPLVVSGQDAASAKATFEAVNQHLDLGGQFYGFLNVDGDFEVLAEKTREFYEQLQIMEGAVVDVEGFLGVLGFDNLDGVGMSSIKFGKGFRNRFFAAIDGEREGLLKLSGGEPKPFAIGQFAPDTAVYALEWDLDLAGVKEVVRGIGAQLEAVMGMDPTAQVFQQPIPGTELNVEQLVDALKGLALAYAEIDEEQKLQIPDPNAPEIPGIDLVLGHANGKVLFEHLKSFVTSNAPPDAYRLEETDGVTQLHITLPPDASLGFYAPVIQVDDASGQLLVASRPEALERQSQGDRLADATEFKALAERLPKEGNGYEFMSPKVYDLIDVFVDGMRSQSLAMADFQAQMMMAILGEPQAMAGMWANQDGGIYSESYAPMSYKIYAPVVLALALWQGNWQL